MASTIVGVSRFRSSHTLCIKHSLTMFEHVLGTFGATQVEICGPRQFSFLCVQIWGGSSSIIFHLMAWSLIGISEIGDNFEVHGNVLKGLCCRRFRASEFLRHISPLRASSLAIRFDMLKKQDKCSRRGHCSWLVIYEHSADYCENAGNMPGN